MTWNEPEKWQKLWDGTACPMCNDNSLEVNDFGYLIDEFPTAYWRLAKNQHPRGWSVVSAKTHVPEVYLMTEPDRAAFFNAVAVASQKTAEAFNAVKIHTAIFGTICPHVHCHILPKYIEDDPRAPLAFGAMDNRITDAHARELVATLRRGC